MVVAALIPGKLSGFIGGFHYESLQGIIYSTIGLILGSWLAFLAYLFLENSKRKTINRCVFGVTSAD